jgi:hypothetical protein
MRDPTGKALKDVNWLIRTHAVTVLPSVASLKVLRGKSAVADAKSPLIGFANPVFDRTPEQLQQNVHVAANVTASRGLRGAVATSSPIGPRRKRPRRADWRVKTRTVPGGAQRYSPFTASQANGSGTKATRCPCGSRINPKTRASRGAR